ncbi:reverse transcriptase domain-containing protein, partial [Myxococcota bacterium]
LDCSYGFRPRRSAHQALEAVRKAVRSGRNEVYDLDLQSYFDTIPHDKLMAALRVRITDRTVLKLIRMWLKAPVIDERDGGGPRRRHQGTPQGGVISPLLANVFLHWFDVFFHSVTGPGHWAYAKLVRYADDAVVLARYQGPQLRQWLEDTLEIRMELQINRAKTRVVDLQTPGESFDFLGYTFRYDRDLLGGSHRYLNVGPSKKATAREREKLRSLISARTASVPLPELVTSLNRHLRGWLNYFSYGYPAMAHRVIRNHLNTRLRQHLRRRSQRPYRLPKGVTLHQHLQQMGLLLS